MNIGVIGYGFVGRATGEGFASSKKNKVFWFDKFKESPYSLEEVVENSEYIFIGVSESKEAIPAALQHKPFAVILDLAIPDVDGWELLSKFREHPDLKNLQIIICSILPQEPLSLALGASAFLRKPINQDLLLKTLRQVSTPRDFLSD